MDRIEREKRVVGQMIAIYCRGHHRPEAGGLCPDCRSLLDYACRRVDCCPKGSRKSSCRKCEIHCYTPANRAKIRAVMKYAGPRMILIHPLAAIRHLIAEMR